MHTKYLIKSMLAAGCCALGAVGYAQETHKGPLTITRHLELQGSYDDNIFLRSSAGSATPLGSGIATLSHDLGFALDEKRTQASIGYTISLIQYDKFPGVNNAVHQEVTARLDHQPGERSAVGLSDDFKATTDPASSEFVDRARRNQNDADVHGEIGLGPSLFAALRVEHLLHYYYGQSTLAHLLNRKGLGVEPRVGYKLTEKTRVYGEYAYERMRYDYGTGATKDNDSNGFMVGAEGEFTSRIKGSVAAGAKMRSYLTSVSLMTGSQTIPAWDAQVTMDAPSDFGIVLALSRGPQEGLFNRFMVSTMETLAVNRPFGKFVTASVFGMLVSDAYPDYVALTTSKAKRADTTVQAGATLKWKPLSFLTVDGGFTLRQRASNYDVFDYTDHLTTLGVEAVY